MLIDARYLLLLALVVSVACGGGSGGGPSLTATYTADAPIPSADTVSLAPESAGGNTATVVVNLTDTNGVWGALFDLVYPASVSRFVSWSAGSALEAGGNTVSYIVDEPVAGRLVISVSRQGSVPGANVAGTQPLVRLVFRATQAGSGTVRFENTALVDEQNPPQDLPGISWAGGAVTVQ